MGKCTDSKKCILIKVQFSLALAAKVNYYFFPILILGLDDMLLWCLIRVSHLRSQIKQEGFRVLKELDACRELQLSGSECPEYCLILCDG
jgi:hypothetical protein